MAVLTAEKLIIAFRKLSDFLKAPGDAFSRTVQAAPNHNAWFTPAEAERALSALQHMLEPDSLETWFKEIRQAETPKNIGLILAGNIPMVGFHDVLSVLATGNRAMIKLSASDSQLLPALLNELVNIEPLLADRIVYAERLKDFDAVIATGSNNTSRYFDYYFGKVPHIIRRNRNSVAILDGRESPAEIEALGHDIFDYFGLGCRNVSKIYLPEGYEIKNFYEPLQVFQPVINHFKYNNNYDYNKSIYLVNTVPHFDNGFLLLKEDEGLASPLAVQYYEFYRDAAQLAGKLNAMQESIQCAVTHMPLALESGTAGFGQSQYPQLWDYADHINTVEFLNGL